MFFLVATYDSKKYDHISRRMIRSDTRTGTLVVGIFPLFFHYTASSLVFLSWTHFITGYYEPQLQADSRNVHLWHEGTSDISKCPTAPVMADQFLITVVLLIMKPQLQEETRNDYLCRMGSSQTCQVSDWNCGAICGAVLGSPQENGKTSVSLLSSKLRFTVRYYSVLFRRWSGAFLCDGMCMEDSSLGPLFQSQARSLSSLIDVKAFRKLQWKRFAIASVAEATDRRSMVNKVTLYIPKCSIETVIADLFRASTSSNA